MYLVRAGWVFDMIFKLAKPFIPYDTLVKLKMPGSDYKKQLLKSIDED